MPSDPNLPTIEKEEATSQLRRGLIADVAVRSLPDQLASMVTPPPATIEVSLM